MGATYEGRLDGTGLRIGLVASRFNDFIVEHLVRGARDALRQCGVDGDAVELARVPGSFEMPLVARRMAETGRFDAIVCLGCIIRGATKHYDLVCGEAARGIAQAAAQTGVPAIFSVVTAETIEQAIERSGTKMSNKGYEGGLAAVEMVNLLRSLDKGARSPGRRRGKRT